MRTRNELIANVKLRVKTTELFGMANEGMIRSAPLEYFQIIGLQRVYLASK